MSTNHLHYFDNIAEEIKWTNLINEGYRFTKPEFVGQGWTYSVGSDSYGGYVTEIKTVGNKIIYGLVNANCIMHSSWTEGTLDCSMPIDRTPTKWIVQRG